MPDQGGGQPQQSYAASGPAPYAKPHIVGDPKQGIPGVLPEAQKLYQAPGPNYYPGSTVADFSPEQNLAMEGTANRALSGSPLNAQAGQELTKTLQGGYLGQANPYMAGINQQGLDAASGAAAQFGQGGRTGSGAAQGQIASAYTGATAPYQYGAYEAERGRMQNAMQFAPTLAGQDYVDLQALQGVGTQRQGQQQAQIGADVARYDYGQNQPQNKINAYLAAIYGAPGQQSNSTLISAQPGMFQQAAGAGIGLAGLGLQAYGGGLFG